ncbi:GNAT family protein [Paraclostridium bifermentans]|uniref:GNAT family N-acetyltransferase n=1 Tax=Paraclostridium bifermentans TaxID=1490 RepID=UPI00296F842A
MKTLYRLNKDIDTEKSKKFKKLEFSSSINCLSRQFWNMGIMTEAMTGVIDFLFKEVGLNRIVAMHNVDNIQSGKVMIKSNMKYEGTLREADILRDKDGFYNLAVYSILKSEWESMYD